MKHALLLTSLLLGNLSHAQTITLPKEFAAARGAIKEAKEEKVDITLPKTVKRAEAYYAEGLAKYLKTAEKDPQAALAARELANEARALAEDALTLAEDIRSWDNDMQEYLEIKSLIDMDFDASGHQNKLSSR